MSINLNKIYSKMRTFGLTLFWREQIISLWLFPKEIKLLRSSLSSWWMIFLGFSSKLRNSERTPKRWSKSPLFPPEDLLSFSTINSRMYLLIMRLLALPTS